MMKGMISERMGRRRPGLIEDEKVLTMLEPA